MEPQRWRNASTDPAWTITLSSGNVLDNLTMHGHHTLGTDHKGVLSTAAHGPLPLFLFLVVATSQFDIECKGVLSDGV